MKIGSKISGALGTAAGLALTPFVRAWVWFQSSQTPKPAKVKKGKDAPIL